MGKIILKVLLFGLFIICNGIFSQSSKYIRKAEGAVYSGKYETARVYYSKALEQDANSFKANYGMGILLSEYLMNYEKSLPFLEKAVELSPNKDSVPELMFSLGKVYAFYKKYDLALSYFEKLLPYQDNVDDESFKRELNKRIFDCYYAKKNSQQASSKELYIVNAGKSINTEMDEYVPVLTPNNQILFTSKRKDGPKEKINPDNGKYFEAMYIADIRNGYTSNTRLFSNITSKTINGNESVVSIFPDGKKLFVYKDKKLYEVSFDRTEKKYNTNDLLNFDEYQNHACLSKDGNTVYFTSESSTGNGGNDIYFSVKNADGAWGTPQNLGKVINTSRDEEAPFVSLDGKTLYFSSNGHNDCYGEFDIYKSELVNGEWTKPINMGLPINSSGNDVFYVISEDPSYAYFSSSRIGGQGDLDIYKVIFPGKIKQELQDCGSNVLAVDTKQGNENAYKYKFSIGIPAEMKNKVLSFSFYINDSIITKQETDEIEIQFKTYGDYKLKAKLIAACDTCITPYIACFDRVLSVKDTTPIVAVNNNTNNNGNTSNNNGNVNNNNGNNNNSSNNNGNTNNNSGNNNTSNANNSVPVKGQMSNEELAQIGLNLKPLYFSFDKDELRDDAIASLKQNIEILKKYPDLKIYVYGHTDARGGKKRNYYLSYRRALMVEKYLIKEGIKRSRIIVFAKGETELVNNCIETADCDKEAHQLNRRVELKVIKK